jgi:hypothetical protein
MNGEYSNNTRLYVVSVKAGNPACEKQLAQRQFRAMLYEANVYAMEGKLDASLERDRQAEDFRQAQGY